jgi:hypothetical protein
LQRGSPLPELAAMLLLPIAGVWLLVNLSARRAALALLLLVLTGLLVVQARFQFAYVFYSLAYPLLALLSAVLGAALLRSHRERLRKEEAVQQLRVSEERYALAAKANAQHRLVLRYSSANPVELRLQPVSDAGIVPSAPGSTQWDDEVVIIKVRKLKAGLVWGAEKMLRHNSSLFNLKSMVAQALRNRASWAHMVMLNKQCPHGTPPKSRKDNFCALICN